MRIVVPYTSLHEATTRSLDQHAPDHELHQLNPDDETGYWRLLTGLWESAEDFAIIEHDMEINDQVIPAFHACNHAWCVYPYEGPPHPLAPRNRVFRCALGCTRFRSELTTRYPTLLRSLHNPRSTTIIFGRQANTRWDALDSQIASLLYQHGERQHEHTPWVNHHHQVCGCTTPNNVGGRCETCDGYART